MDTIMYMVGYDRHFKTVAKTAGCSTGWGCGYVMIPLEHPVAKTILKSYADYAEQRPEEFNYLSDHVNLHAHGGITYAEVEDGYLTVGFDTAHLGDGPHLDFKFVLTETKALQKQIEERG